MPNAPLRSKTVAVIFQLRIIMKLRFLVLFFIMQTGFAALQADTVIEVAAKLADVPGGTKIPASPAQLAKNKGINLLAATPVSVASGARARIEINQPVTTASGSTVSLGLTLDVLPILAESGNISFTGSALDRARAMSGQESTVNLTTMEFATREVYFQGFTKGGESVLIQTAPIESAVKGSKNSARQLVIYLTFTKKTVASAKTPAKTPTKSSKTKTTAKGTTSKGSSKKTKR